MQTMRMEEEAAQYNDSNRAFLQAFIARGTLTFREAQPLLADIFTAFGRHHAPGSRPRLTPDQRAARPRPKM